MSSALHAPVVVAVGRLGVGGVVVPLDGIVADTLGLASPLGARITATNPTGNAGHEKVLPWAWLFADFADPAAPPPYDVTAAQIAAARHALTCGDLAELIASTREPMTVGRFFGNLAGSLRRTRLVIPSDPIEAERALCAASDDVGGAPGDERDGQHVRDDHQPHEVAERRGRRGEEQRGHARERGQRHRDQHGIAAADPERRQGQDDVEVQARPDEPRRADPQREHAQGQLQLGGSSRHSSGPSPEMPTQIDSPRSSSRSSWSSSANHCHRVRKNGPGRASTRLFHARAIASRWASVVGGSKMCSWKIASGSRWL